MTGAQFIIPTTNLFIACTADILKCKPIIFTTMFPTKGNINLIMNFTFSILNMRVI